MKKNLYLFDFDGTLTRKDTLFDFLKFYNPQQYFFILLLYLPTFILLKLGLKRAESVKRNLISSFLKGQTIDKLKTKSIQYFQVRKDKILREKAVEFIEKLDENDSIVIVSASLDIWLEPFAEYFKALLICTNAEYHDDIFTGNFISPNCNYVEKKKRILDTINLDEYEKIFAFGDSSGDFEMFSLAHKYYLNHF